MKKLVVLDPGHFHAALLQKTMYPDVDPTVHVYADDGPDLADYLQKIDGYNARGDRPTAWRTVVHAGPDFLERFSAERAGDFVVIAGNNRRKTEYVIRAIEAGMHVLADKPMAIDHAGFESLREAFSLAQAKGVLLYDIMTERHEITTMLQKVFSHMPAVFGDMLEGSEEEPAIVKESIHHFSKAVSGVPIKRPAWFFDVAQQGEGLVDITTHLVDLVQWECFPGAILDLARDLRILGARRWPTAISSAQFAQVTRLPRYPEFLRKDVAEDGTLQAYANGEIDYRIKGVHAKVRVLWNFEAPDGGGDTHYSIMRGSKANLVIRQGAAEAWRPVLYIEPAASARAAELATALQGALPALHKSYAGVGVQRLPEYLRASRSGIRPGGGPADSCHAWQVQVPESYHVGHEAHFAQVASQFLGYVGKGALPDWEVPNMIAKYGTTTRALELARAATASPDWVRP